MIQRINILLLGILMFTATGYSQVDTTTGNQPADDLPEKYKQADITTDTTKVTKSSESKKPLTRILIIFDSSQSMLGRWDGRRKIDIARNLLSEMLDSLRLLDDVEVALRVYGHQKQVPPQDCSDTKLEVPFEKDNIEKIKFTLENLVARGTTPIARSLEEGSYDFPGDKSARNIIILITDGVEACEGDPCAVSLALQEKGVILKPFIIGVGLDVEFKDVFDCVGFYFDANNSKQFRHALNAIVDQVMNFTSAQVNLLDTEGKPNETNVAMSFYDELSGALRYNYVHTINEQGQPDTVLLDIMTKYDLEVHTIPPVRKDSIVLEPGIHNIIELPAPQGFMEIKTSGKNIDTVNIPCIIRKAGEMKTLHVQNTNSLEKYITGKYDLEILTNPRINISGIEITQSEINEVIIPQPGTLKIEFKHHPIGSILHEEGDKQTQVHRLDPYNKNAQMLLQPGTYKLVYRYAKDKKTRNSVENSFTIKPGKTLIIKTD
ncbi:MAG: vWA domain-containing protein [Bacteroidota bacterium]